MRLVCSMFWLMVFVRCCWDFGLFWYWVIFEVCRWLLLRWVGSWLSLWVIWWFFLLSSMSCVLKVSGWFVCSICWRFGFCMCTSCGGCIVISRFDVKSEI